MVKKLRDVANALEKENLFALAYLLKGNLFVLQRHPDNMKLDIEQNNANIRLIED
jgi:hypothetical protein